MKILFIVPLSSTMAGLDYVPTFPHLGIASLAAMLKDKHEVRLLDMRIARSQGNLINVIRRYKPELVGVTAASFQYKKLYRMVDKIKQEGDFKVVLGGPHVSIFKRRVLEETSADLAVMGEGEYAMVDICSGKPYDLIDGLIYRKGGSVVENKVRPPNEDLDRLPFSALELFDMEAYADKKIPILTSRGCPYGCIYCSVSLTMGRGFRPRSPENVIDEILYWHKRGYRLFQFQDDCFSFDMDRAKKICELILEKGIEIRWDIRNGLSAGKVDRELLRLMKKAGCVFVAYGIESVDEDVLRNMRKGSSLPQIKNAIRITREAGMDVGGFFVIGLPGDTAEKASKCFDFAKKFNLKEYWFYNAIPYPGTRLYDWAQANARWLVSRHDYLEKAQYFSFEPVYETAEFKKNDRIRVLRVLQGKAMNRIMRNEFGFLIGYMGYLIWKNPFLRYALMGLASRIWKYRRERRRGVA